MYGLFASNENYPNFTKDHTSIVASVLTPQLYDELYYLRTPNGFNLDKAIQLAVDIPSVDVGFIIGDEECCTVFLPLLKKITDKCQKYYNESSHARFVHKTNLSGIKFNEPKTLKNFVLDIKFYLRRNLKGYSLPSHCTRAERREINVILLNLLGMLSYNSETQTFKIDKTKNRNVNSKKRKKKKKSTTSSSSSTISVSSVVSSSDEKTGGDGSGNGGINVLNEKESRAIDLSVIDEGTLSELELLSFAPNRQMSLTEEYLVSGLSRDFPDARSIFYNIEGGIGAWTNHENHLEFVILDEDADLNRMYKKFVNLLNTIKDGMNNVIEMQFIRTKQFGFIVTNPKYLGSALTIDINIKCPKLAQHNDFDEILYKFNLQLIDHSGAVYHMETINTLGRTEHTIVQSLADAINLLFRMEKMLAKNRNIDSIIGLI